MFARYSRSGVILMAAPLYAGPLLAGWSAAPWQTGAVLAGIFFLMQLLRGQEDVGDKPLGLLLLAAVQILLVGVVVAAGMLGATLIGPLDLPVWAPLALTSLGAVIWVLRYRNDAEMARISATIDSALSSIETITPFDPDQTGADTADTAETQDASLEHAVQEALEALWALPEDADLGQIDQIVQTLETRTGAGGFHTLQSELVEGFPIVDLAMLRYLSSPAVRRQLVDSCDIGFALSLLIDSQDAGVIQELATLTATLLDENAPASELPPPDELRRQSLEHPVLAPLVDPVETAYRAWQVSCG